MNGRRRRRPNPVPRVEVRTVAAAAGRSMLGSTAPYDYVHTFWSDQYEHTIEYVGFAAEWDRLVFRGEPAGRTKTLYSLVSRSSGVACESETGGGINDGRGPDDKEDIAVEGALCAGAHRVGEHELVHRLLDGERGDRLRPAVLSDMGPRILSGNA